MKTKKLTALIASAMLAVGTVPANAYAEDVLGDWDGDGMICILDAYNYLEHLIDVENGTVGIQDAETGEYLHTERIMNWVNENQDITGDGVVDKRDFVIVSQLAVEPATEDTKIGDVNHDGHIMKIDGYMIKYYLEDVAEGNADFYTEEQIANFNAYGDIDGDGDVDETDAELIITGDYMKLKDVPQYSVLLDGTILDTEEKREKYYNEFINDTTGRGDVNHDGYVDSVDADMILEYFVNMVTDNYDAYTEEEHENFQKYGDVFNDGVVDCIDASWVLSKEDAILRAEMNGDSTVNNEIGDVNHDGFIDAIDATMIMVYYADLSINNADAYTETEHENFRTYGDISMDGVTDTIDASMILSIYAENATSLAE